MSDISLVQHKNLILIPTLKAIGLYSPSAVNLVLGTALAESNLTYIQQLTGQAHGMTQMEQLTHDDCWINYLKYKVGLANLIKGYCSTTVPDVTIMEWNRRYDFAMCRIKYLRSSQPLPDANDATALANYHKINYNSALGKANPVANIPLFELAIKA